MKYRYLFSDFKPQRKCGPELMAGFASSFLGMYGNAISSGQQSANVARQLAAQSFENQLNRAWQTGEAEKARSWATGAQGQHQQFTQQNMQLQQMMNERSMGLQAQYNSPVYQRQQLQQAGINPQVYFGNQSSFGGSSAQSSSGPQGASAPSAANVGSVQGLSPISFQPESLQLSQLASNLKSIAEAKKLGVETGWIDSEMKAKIRSLNTESDMRQVLMVGQEISNQINKSTMPYQIKMASKNLEKVISEIELNDEGKITQQSIQKVNEAAAKWHDAQAKLTDKEVERMGLEMPYYVNLLVSQINKNQGEAASGFASAEESRATASLTRYQESMARAMEAGNLEMFNDALIKSYNDAEISHAQLDEAQALAEIQKTAASHAEAEFWKNYILDFVGGAVDAVTSWRNSNSWKRLSNAEQQRVRNRMFEIKQKYGDQVELTDMWNGMKRKRVYHSGRSQYGED